VSSIAVPTFATPGKNRGSGGIIGGYAVGGTANYEGQHKSYNNQNDYNCGACQSGPGTVQDRNVVPNH
jgi:hypothetical protein